MRRFVTTLIATSLLLTACSNDRTSETSEAATTAATAVVTTVVESTAVATTAIAPTTTPSDLFADRPFEVVVPSEHDAASAAPLVILLHGYGASGAIQEAYFRLQPEAEARGFIYVHPDGTKNPVGYLAWNATDACCGSAADDSSYITFIIDSVSAAYEIDPARIYLVGHSNGGFMSYRMACDHADRIAAIVSLAGATFLDSTQCTPSEPVNILQIHGTDDQTIHFDGAFTPLGTYPSAEGTVTDWATFNGCASTRESLGAIDLELALDGEETAKQGFTGCPSDGSVELWTITDGSHIPSLTENFAADIIEWLYAHPNT